MWLTLVLLSLTLNGVCSNPGVDLCSICGRHSPTVRDQMSKDHVADYGPWAVSLKIDKRYSCSGSIIGLNHVITSAHCFDHFLPASPVELASKLEVRAGSIKVDPKLFTLLEPEAVIVFPTFDMANISDPHSSTLEDLAIIQLKQPIKVNDKLRPICLGKQVKVKAFDKVVLQGYGLVNCVHKRKGEKTEPSKNLMQAELTVFSEEECKKMYAKKKIEVNDRHICVQPGEDLSTTCPGDSGGILGVNVDVYGEDRLFLVGLTSFGGPGDGQEDEYPAVFTRVHSYQKWIAHVTGIVPCNYDVIEEIYVVNEED